jgi:hypothetical protein
MSAYLRAEDQFCHFTENHELQDKLPQAWDAVYAISDPAHQSRGLIIMDVPTQRQPLYTEVTLYTVAGHNFTIKPERGTRVEIKRHDQSSVVSDFLDAADPATDTRVVSLLEGWARASCPPALLPQLDAKIVNMRAYIQEGIQDRQQAAGTSPNP